MGPQRQSAWRVSRADYVRNERLFSAHLAEHIWLQTEIIVQCTLQETRRIQEQGCSSNVGTTIELNKSVGYGD